MQWPVACVISDKNKNKNQEPPRMEKGEPRGGRKK
jgi:hypothetical protein